MQIRASLFVALHTSFISYEVNVEKGRVGGGREAATEKALAVNSLMLQPY